MSLQNVRNLVKQAPEGLVVGQAWKMNYNAAAKVLKLHKESNDYELTVQQRRTLQARLVTAARVAEDLMMQAANAGRTNQLADNTRLFDDIAEELGLTTDELVMRLYNNSI